jgi:hypothetical protein
MKTDEEVNKLVEVAYNTGLKNGKNGNHSVPSPETK